MFLFRNFPAYASENILQYDTPPPPHTLFCFQANFIPRILNLCRYSTLTPTRTTTAATRKWIPWPRPQSTSWRSGSRSSSFSPWSWRKVGRKIVMTNLANSPTRCVRCRISQGCTKCVIWSAWRNIVRTIRHSTSRDNLAYKYEAKQRFSQMSPPSFLLCPWSKIERFVLRVITFQWPLRNPKLLWIMNGGWKWEE